MEGMFIGTVLEGAKETAIREHAAIVEAIRERDVTAARQRMQEHLRRSYTEWVQAGYTDSQPSFFDVE
jgi:DNA-binding FadR family transcriptional regulator